MTHVSPCTHCKLVNAASQPSSSVTKVLEAVIVYWDAIEAMYEREGKNNPLAG